MWHRQPAAGQLAAPHASWHGMHRPEGTCPEAMQRLQAFYHSHKLKWCRCLVGFDSAVAAHEAPEALALGQLGSRAAGARHRTSCACLSRGQGWGRTPQMPLAESVQPPKLHWEKGLLRGRGGKAPLPAAAPVSAAPLSGLPGAPHTLFNPSGARSSLRRGPTSFLPCKADTLPGASTKLCQRGKAQPLPACERSASQLVRHERATEQGFAAVLPPPVRTLLSAITSAAC